MAGAEKHLDLVQAGDTSRVVKWGDHSMTSGSANASPGVQAVMPPKAKPAPQGAPMFQGLFASFFK